MKYWCITLAFNQADIIEDSLDQFYKMRDPNIEIEHYILDQHWPVKKEYTRQRIREIAAKHGCKVLDAGRNLGLHLGFNFVWSQLAIPANAGVMGLDPDTWPLTPGFDMAMAKAFVTDPSLAWLSLWHTHSDRQLITEQAGLPPRMIGGVRCMELVKPVMNSICLWRQSWLMQTQGIHEGNAFYGSLEVFQFELLKNYKWVFLPDYHEDLRMHDRVHPLYREWKTRHAWTRDYAGDFESFLKSFHPTALA